MKGQRKTAETAGCEDGSLKPLTGWSHIFFFFFFLTTPHPLKLPVFDCKPSFMSVFYIRLVLREVD